MNLTNITTFPSYNNFTRPRKFINPLIDRDVEESLLVIFLGVLVLGILINVIAFFTWLIGPKSKSLCCATYFAANAVADFLCLTIPGLIQYLQTVGVFHHSIYSKTGPWYMYIEEYTTDLLLASSNWISVSITIERALTMFCPFVFRPQAMRKRSKYVVLAICVLLVSTYVQITEIESSPQWKANELCDLTVRIVVPFILIVTIDTAVVATLCKKRFQQNTVSTNRRSYVEVFTKITILTGLSFMLSNTTGVISLMFYFGFVDFGGYPFTFNKISRYMYFFNCFANPVICFAVCKSVRDDLRFAVCMVAKKCRNTCHCRQLEPKPEPVHV